MRPSPHSPSPARPASLPALLLAPLLLLGACASNGDAPADDPSSGAEGVEAPPAEAPPAEPEWQALFNGRDLDGWTPKFTGHPLGENLRDTFRVRDGLLQVRYDGWEGFQGEFGHLIFEQPFSSYDLRIEYRFVGDQVPGGPGWAFRNSGVMLHGQDPATMTLDQEFPVSIEAQMLGGDGNPDHARPNGNLCTPGTNVVMDGELVTRHCTNSTSGTYHGDEWVVLELEVRGHEVIRHRLDGEVVLEYTEPQLDPRDGDAAALLAGGVPPQLAAGWISIQAESHPLDVRSIEVRVVDEID